jgi:hypothetical protein
VRNAPANIQIGHDPTGAFFNGIIDDVRLFDRVLSSSEIATLAFAPSAPKGLTAKAAGVQVLLNWAEEPGAITYNLSRSITNGGPYEFIADGLTSTNFIDTNVLTGVTYYYVVSCMIGFYESTNSTVASSTPQGPLRLSCGASIASGCLVLSWPDWVSGGELCGTSNLTLPVTWAPVTNVVAISNGFFKIALPIGLGQQYFRLSYSGI